jgi:hypothetical protein
MKAAIIVRPNRDHLKIEEPMPAAIAAPELGPVIDRVFPLAAVRAAIESLGAARRGDKVCFSI